MVDSEDQHPKEVPILVYLQPYNIAQVYAGDVCTRRSLLPCIVQRCSLDLPKRVGLGLEPHFSDSRLLARGLSRQEEGLKHPLGGGCREYISAIANQRRRLRPICESGAPFDLHGFLLNMHASTLSAEFDSDRR
ncbi:hypothetical protein HRR83_008323 [Exophiala dermatitidis]|uniref:Uncharacterized protein n=1 Tax=Exophiala dermatitidis TaxID=5970 RepID=A0AAN6EM76_EXODE|nr:hypothetical protein HRR73_007886 [Exophiala dermatitidis]KAJ4507661.1 hypothetical protein HRR74_007988 [Exophiala dermatitidis]KAJ4533036.1 hypothetical protein HRR76_008007 [Exophiala dermatitidis]KAJ4535230.1 hypothetical protein HRR77_008141 [Exophiala dermatitidis]KAJ4560683.1 hypothetical protein HRR79_007805 [Exophiala dermatitidis]